MSLKGRRVVTVVKFVGIVDRGFGKNLIMVWHYKNIHTPMHDS